MPATTEAGLAAARRCGADEAPDPELMNGRYSDGVAKAQPGRSRRFAAALARVDGMLRGNSDPYPVAIATWVDASGDFTETERVGRLATIAATSVDPRVYALAFGACASQRAAPPSCRLLSARQWAQLDDGNVQPWLSLYEEAASRGDLQGEDEALRGAAASTHADARLFLPAAVIGAMFPDDDDMAAATAFVSTKAYMLSVSQPLRLRAVFDGCRNGAGGDAVRASRCVQVANVMMDHSTDLLTQAMGGGLDFLATGDPTRRDRLRAERAAVSAGEASGVEAARELSGCGRWHAAGRHFVRVVEVGELRALEEQNRMVGH